jgi:hypothetical protein
MSISDDTDTDAPNPRDDPEAVIREELGDHREALQDLAEMDLGPLSADARKALAILEEDQEGSS